MGRHMTDPRPIKEDVGGEAPAPVKDREVDAFAKEAEANVDKQLAQDMQQQRGARKVALGFLVFLAVVSGLMMLSLWFSVYFCNGAPFKIFLERGARWPLGLFISGTFLGFIAVCGGLAFGAFTALRRGPDKE